ncbi:P-loop containing nucleoside triphosphate hydrolase protein, partial [Microdochium trichocladiopsis]
MRLLQLKADGSLRLEDHPHEDAPPYAILSHTWGPDDQEITFQDVQHHTGHHKDGYQKLTFCGQQAALDGLKHFWTDTCCIDKSNSQELQEAINSMFCWYRDANHCYVFLTDVHKSSSDNDDHRLSQGQWKTAFRSSRWLTRGWTLQELIAPRSVKFFSAEGKALGDKNTLEALLHECTGVPIDALRGRPPADFSINERLSWLGNRKTKRPEDLAYCMFGIFDVHMPLIYSEGQEKAFLRLRREIEPTPRRVEPFSTVPFLPDADFVERPDVTAWLDTTLAQPGGRAALVGLGGIGKSQVAIEYAHQTRQRSPSTYVLWVYADTEARFEEAYRGIADRLQLPRRHDPKVDVLQLVYDWLFNAENGQWLMILDNADDVEVFFPRRPDRAGTSVSKQRPLGSLLPQSTNGRILITSRSREAAQRMTGSKWKTFPMQVMDENQATQLLQKKLRDEYEEKAAALLSGALEYVPLAITQAAAYIVRRSPRISCSSYLEQFRKSEKKKESLLDRDLGDLRRDGMAANSVVVTWQITFEQIQKERRSAADLLSLMSHFDPQEIPEWVLRSYYQRRCRSGKHHDNGKETDEDGEDYHGEDGLDDDLETLRDYSLVAVTVQQGIYEMHALVQFCARAWLSSVGDIARWKQIFLHIMSENYPPGSYENWSKCQQLEPHIAQLVETQPADAKGATEWARLLTNAGLYGWQVGVYDRAEALLWKAVEVREAVLGAENSNTLTSVSNLALVLRYQGKYEEAEVMNRRALDGSEKALGKHHPNTLTSIDNLALVLLSQGKYEEA